MYRKLCILRIQISIHRAPTFSKALIKRHVWIRVFYENKTQRVRCTKIKKKKRNLFGSVISKRGNIVELFEEMIFTVRASIKAMMDGDPRRERTSRTINQRAVVEAWFGTRGRSLVCRVSSLLAWKKRGITSADVHGTPLVGEEERPRYWGMVISIPLGRNFKSSLSFSANT